MIPVFQEGIPINEVDFKRQCSNSLSLEGKLFCRSIEFLCLKSTAHIYGCIRHCLASQKRKQNQRKGYSHHKQFPYYHHCKKEKTGSPELPVQEKIEKSLQVLLLMMPKDGNSKQMLFSTLFKSLVQYEMQRSG